MEKKRLILTMLLSMVIIFGWNIMVYQWQKKNPPATQPAAGSTTSTAPSVAQTLALPATTQQIAAAPTTTPTTQTTPTLAAAALAPVAPATSQPVTITLGTPDTFNSRLVISPRAGSISRVELKEYNDWNGKKPYIFQSPYDPDRPDTAALALRSIIVNGTLIDLSNATWSVTASDDKSARLVLEIQNRGEPYLRIIRTFELATAQKTTPGRGYDHTFTQTFENLSGQPLTIRFTTNGLNQPQREIERSPDLAVLVGHNDEGEVKVYSHPVEGFTSSKPTLDLTTADTKLPLIWTGAASVYFNAILRPHPLDNTTAHANYIASVIATALNPDETDVFKHQVRTNVESTDLVLQPNQPLTLASSIFLGPRQRSLLRDNYYDAFPRDYDKTLVIPGACGWCTFQPLINLLVTLLGFFHMLLRDWGLAIICLVLLVRAILHPITKRSQVSMMKMGKMGPEVERLKKKYGDNKDELNKAMMQVYKEQGFTPVLGCLPMFLQMPIWIALWSALQSTFELRQAPFLYGLTWIDDLAKPDQLFVFPRAIPLVFGWQLHAINLLPLLMVGVTYLNQKFMPKPVATTPEQEQQQKMMLWMTMVFPLMFYSFPSGLNLYYVTSMGLGIIESKIVRDHIKKKEEEEKSGKVIIDAPPTRAAKTRKPDKPEPEKKSFFGKLLADLQAKAEQVRKEADRKR